MVYGASHLPEECRAHAVHHSRGKGCHGTRSDCVPGCGFAIVQWHLEQASYLNRGSIRSGSGGGGNIWVGGAAASGYWGRLARHHFLGLQIDVIGAGAPGALQLPG